jgi:hypothetical protein
MAETNDGDLMRWQPLINKVLAGLILAGVIGTFTSVRSLQNQIGSIREWQAETRGNRYTAKDHSTYVEQHMLAHLGLHEELAEIRTEMSRVNEKLGWMQQHMRENGRNGGQ